MPDAESYQQYEVLRREDGTLWELGRGSMGITYKAYDTNLHCTVALKVINSTYLENDTARQRFLREARSAAALRHPNVASVFNLGTDQDRFFYVMEFIDGETVETRVNRQGRLQPEEALKITLQVARALAAADKQRLVHRDLKPSNLMLVDQEGESVVKVIDFGLAKGPKNAGEDTLTLTVAGFVGTPHFASPEQVEEGDLDVRSDIYSLGATLYFMIAGKVPFTGSVGQVMSQHLYKSISIEALTDVPPCVVSLIQSMLEKDRDQRPQTPRDLQNAIVECLEEIRVGATGDVRGIDETPPRSFSQGALLGQNYHLIEELGQGLEGRHFLAVDLRRRRQVSLLVLNQALVSDHHSFAALEAAIERLRIAPHPLLLAIHSLERARGYAILVEEHVVGPSLLELLRSRSVLSAPEVVRLISLLAPLADHASANGLEHIDFTLMGIHFLNRKSTVSEIAPDLLHRPLSAWDQVEIKVSAIDFSFVPSDAGTRAGLETLTRPSTGDGPRGSYVRMLSLLAHELLGGPRGRVEGTGRYTPIAALTQEGNAVLRRGLIDECRSASELAAQLAAAVRIKDSAARPLEKSEPVTREPLRRAVPAELPVAVSTKRSARVPPMGLILAIGLIALIGIGGYLIYLSLTPSQETITQSQEITALSIQSDPPGATILLDGKPAQIGPNTFTHVPFGPHRLTATLDNYESIEQELQVTRGMAPEIHLKLKQTQEIATLSIQSDPPGAKILLDGKPAQIAPNTFTHVPFGPHRLTATLDNYESIEQELQVTRGMAPEIHLKLKPTQEIATLSIQSDPPGAKILLDGKPAQIAPNTFTHVPFGPHRLTATLDNYESIEQELQVTRGMASEIHLKLKPTQEIATLLIQSDPPGAKILLDGKPAQIAPNTFTHVPFGSHRLTATLDNYESIEQELQVTRGMASEIHLKLKQTQEIATLLIQSDPPGAKILLDGKPAQIGPNTFTHVPFGSHRLTATLDNYESIEQELPVTKGMAPEIHLKLKPTQEIATLLIQSDPPGAKILLDGKPAQIGPNTFTHVPFGPHRLTATLDNYESIEQELQVTKGMAPEIHLKLKETQEIATLLIQSDPPGATILLDGKPAQIGPNTFTHVPFGPHRLTATLDNYESIEQELQVTRGMASEIHLKLKQTQEIATLSIQSDPPGAKILLDGKPAQIAPNTFTHVPFGPHRLTATLDNYESIEQELQVTRGMAPEIHLKLKETQAIATLLIQSDPPGAKILLDGKPAQIGSNTFTHVPFGSHRLTATLDNYESIEQELQVTRGMASEIHLKLKQTQEIATLLIQSDPPGAKILLDGKPAQIGPNTFTHVPFGPHRLTATLDNYESIEQELQVSRGMAPEIHLKLKQTQEIATLLIQSDPPGAKILLDGKPAQIGPNTFTHVPFGSHRLTATLDNYESIEQELQVSRGMAPEIHLKLKPTQEIATLLIQSDPPGAKILLDGKPAQIGPNTFTHVPFGPHQLTATLDNYESIEQELQVTKGMAPEIHLKLKQTQEIATLLIQSDPPGAKILLDGKPAQIGPNTFTHVPFGPHRLTATLDNYESIEQELQVSRGMAPEIRLKLQQSQEIATLLIQSDPPGAKILLDGKPAQIGPNTFTHVPFGPHQLIATLDNYEPIKQELEVTKGMAPEIHLKLKQKPNPLDSLKAEVKKYDEGTPQQLTAYVQIVQFLTTSKGPELGKYTEELTRIVEQLRTKASPITKDEFSVAYKESIREAANLNILPAIVWLAENEKGNEASNLFLRAANLGDSYAMMKLGRLYLKKPNSNDKEEGFKWLNRAYNAPNRNLESGAYIGDCYLSGIGTKLDWQKGKEIVMNLANQEVVPAMTLCGSVFQKEAENKRQEAESSTNSQVRKQLNAQADELDRQARVWWERGAEKGDWNASAHLGEYYEVGRGGLEKSEDKAEKLYKDGTDHGNALSMFHYGLLLLGKNPDDRNEAETFISQAATVGLQKAIKWCEQNHVTFTKVSPE